MSDDSELNENRDALYNATMAENMELQEKLASAEKENADWVKSYDAQSGQLIAAEKRAGEAEALARQNQRFLDLCHMRATKAEAERDRYKTALIKLRDCDWVISLPDRMDAVREIAGEALSTPPAGQVSKEAREQAYRNCSMSTNHQPPAPEPGKECRCASPLPGHSELCPRWKPSEPPRCKHGVISVDHCYQCEEDGKRIAEIENKKEPPTKAEGIRKFSPEQIQEMFESSCKAAQEQMDEFRKSQREAMKCQCSTGGFCFWHTMICPTPSARKGE